MQERTKHSIIDAEGLERTLMRLASHILERNKGADNLVLVGIRTRGVPIAQRLSRIISDLEDGKVVPVGILDIALYRDDFRSASKMAEVKATEIDFKIQDCNVVLVDDVLYTGRTARSAIHAILDYGRPQTIQLAVMIDRGHREMPIQGDFVGRSIVTSPGEEVRVRLSEIDGVDGVFIVEEVEEALRGDL